MAFTNFHPCVQRWFTTVLGTPTPAQVRGWASIGRGRHTLIAAPTGSGKTLAAFLTAIDELFREGLAAPLDDEVRVLYVSPLKALSADIHRNLAEPRRGIRRLAEEAGLAAPRITAAVRTGDTPQAERAAMLRTPPHILVTTPESLYLLLTSDRSRRMLRSVRTVIVDEIHAVIGTRRGAHLALSLERLRHLAERPQVRLGLSATQKPIAEVARFLVGAADDRGCAIVDEGHRREMDLGVEIPRSSLDAVMSREVWEEYYDRLAALIQAHRTTLVFVNTRRLAERLARHLSDRLGNEAIAAHHGSLAREKRLDAETRLKAGGLKALVATASLELGIDIGHVDLVCQVGSPRRIATLLQRVGRSGHTVDGVPRGRLFPVSRDDLVECAALLRSARRGELDAIVAQEAPLDVLAQQIVAESACCAWREDDLFALARRAWPYRDLPRPAFDAVVAMTADGFSTRRGRRAALIHRDEVNGTVRARRGARLLALTSGGAIPEVADYRVLLEPNDTFIGTLNEDFAIESMAGDVFQLGNASWRVLQVGAGVVRVADAKGSPPNIPFWFGEAPARSDELSRAVSDLRRDVERALAGDQESAEDEDTAAGPDASGPAEAGHHRSSTPGATGPAEAGHHRSSIPGATGPAEARHHEEHARNAPGGAAGSGLTRQIAEWLSSETGLTIEAAAEAVEYFAEGRRVLGTIPTQQTLVLERFFDQSGGMQLVLHAPFGSRVNKAWGLALRKRFCRQFNFELQAAATDDAVLLSLGAQHSFPLSDVFRYLHPETTRDVLVQAFLDAPVFQTRWRWNATIALAVPRSRGGRRLAPQLQRMLADDLMAAVFPDAAACLENIPGDRQIPDHPLVDQTVRDCLQEAMDFDGLRAVLARVHAGELTLVARDTPEPSLFAHEILNARPYAFLDDAPLEERRAHAVQTRRAGDGAAAAGLGALDPAAIERVRDEERPDPRDEDELHDALMTAGFLHEWEVPGCPFIDGLVSHGRATRVRLPWPDRTDREGPCIWVTAERVPELLAVHPGADLTPYVTPPPSRRSRAWTREQAIVELLRGRLTIAGPATAQALASSLCVAVSEADAALLALESEGVVLRGRFSPGAAGLEWCDRALLARIHRYTLNRLRAEIEPVSPADFMRFLMHWQHVEPSARLTGPDGLREVVCLLDGFELAADAWERAILPARLERYEPAMLDMLCLAGEIGWGRLSAPTDEPGRVPRLAPATQVALFLREHRDAWAGSADATGPPPDALTENAGRVFEELRRRGASFFNDLALACRLERADLRQAIGELVARGLAASDGFAGLRALIAANAPATSDRRTQFAGRWTATGRRDAPADARDRAIEVQAAGLLRRYGVLFRRLLAREANAAPWRDLVRVLRRLEARGEIRGGRFVSGMSGEQFARPDAVERLREVRRTRPDGRLIAISTADPLNLAGILTDGERVRAAGRNRILYRDGVPIAAREGDFLRQLVPIDPAEVSRIWRALRTVTQTSRVPGP